MSEANPLKKLEEYAILANQMEKDEIDIVKISEKYGNNVKQLANWMRSLTATDYGYKYLRKEGYSEEQIGPWVRRQPAEKQSYVRNKSSPENLVRNGENLLREVENFENEKSSPENLVRNGENLENEKSSPENLVRNGENLENVEDETPRIPKPEGNKGTQSTGGSQSSPLTFSHNSQQFSGENNFSQSSHLSQLSPEQLSSLGMMRDGKGDYFHVSNTEDGGYRLSPATEESLAAAVAGIQCQAQKTQKNSLL